MTRGDGCSWLARLVARVVLPGMLYVAAYGNCRRSQNMV